LILSSLLLLPQALSFELDAVGIVDAGFEERIGHIGFPMISRQRSTGSRLVKIIERDSYLSLSVLKMSMVRAITPISSW
jgi:hypothetical protein